MNDTKERQKIIMRNWKRWTRHKSFLEESMQMKCWRHKGVNIFYIPAADWNSKNVRKSPRSQRTHSKAGTTRSQERTSRRTGRSSTDRTKRWRRSHERLWVFKVASSIVITMNLQFNSKCRKKNIPCPTELHWRNQSYLHKSGCIARKNVFRIIGMWTRIEVYQIPGKDSRSSLYCKRNLQRENVWSGRRLTTTQTTTRRENVWPEVWTKIGKATQKKEKQVCANEKPKLDITRRLRGI